MTCQKHQFPFEHRSEANLKCAGINPCPTKMFEWKYQLFFTLNLNIFQFQKMASLELFDFIPHMVEDQRSLLVKMSPIEKTIMAIIIAGSLVWGSLMKLFIYFYISKQKISERPIHILILLDQIIHHVMHTFIAVGFFARVIFTASGCQLWAR